MNDYERLVIFTQEIPTILNSFFAWRNSNFYKVVKKLNDKSFADYLLVGDVLSYKYPIDKKAINRNKELRKANFDNLYLKHANFEILNDLHFEMKSMIGNNKIDVTDKKQLKYLISISGFMVLFVQTSSTVFPEVKDLEELVKVIDIALNEIKSEVAYI